MKRSCLLATKSDLLSNLSEIFMQHFCLYLIGQNLVTWLLLTTKEAEKCSLLIGSTDINKLGFKEDEERGYWVANICFCHCFFKKDLHISMPDSFHIKLYEV